MDAFKLQELKALTEELDNEPQQFFDQQKVITNFKHLLNMFINKGKTGGKPEIDEIQT